jgi:hypothetical protein
MTANAGAGNKLLMIIQGGIFAWIYHVGFVNRAGSFARRVAIYGGLSSALSWSFTTLAVAAKNLMASVPAYLVIETAFTLVQWGLVAPLMALVLDKARPLDVADRRSAAASAP